jgi:hypothetical protein
MSCELIAILFSTSGPLKQATSAALRQAQGERGTLVGARRTLLTVRAELLLPFVPSP